MKRLNIAIDGPAGAGKSTVAKLLSEKFGTLHLDTGAMYRALALKALEQGIDPNDAERVEPMLPDTRLTVEFREGMQHTMLDGRDVNAFIRIGEVSKGASDIAVIPAVRMKLVETQREIARDHDVVMDGRDIGSYVLPDAEHKFYITADPRVRAERRMKEYAEKGIAYSGTLEDLTAEIIARDHTDSNREFAPLRQAEDAVFIDTTGLSIGEVLDVVLKHIG